MKFRKYFALCAAAVLPLAAPALAQSGLRVGATVTDPQGGAVGTITAIDGTTLMLHTDRHDVRLPVTSFTATDSTILFGMTQAALNAAVEQAEAEAQRAFAVGTTVRDSAGATVGPVTALDADTVTIQVGANAGANVVRVPRAALAAAQGGLVIGATLGQLQAASVPAPQPEPAPAPAPSR